MTIFFYGPNYYELRQQLQQITEKYVAKAGSDFGVERLDGMGVNLHDLTSALQASPFLATSRLVIVEGLAMNKSIGPKLNQVLASVPKTTVAVFVDRDVDQRTNVFKQLSQADKVVKFEPLSGSKLLTWANAEISKLGGKADASAVRELVEVGGQDQWRLSGEINKLVNFDTNISVKTVRALVAPSLEQSIFELVEAMSAGKTGVALSILSAMKTRRESDIYILTMVQWQLRNLLLAKTAPSSMSPFDFAKAAGMSQYVASKMAIAREHINEQTLRWAFEAATECEYEIKSGQLKPELAVERLIYSVAQGTKAQTQ